MENGKATTRAASGGQRQQSAAIISKAQAPAAAAGEGRNGAGGGENTYTQDVQDVAGLLRGDKPAQDAGSGPAADADAQAQDQDQDAQDDAGGDDLAEGDAVTLGELAKALGTKPGTLMDNLQVEVDLPGENGAKSVATVTLGDLRRGYIGAETLRKEREAFEQVSEEKGLEFMRTRADIESLAATVLPHVPPEVQAQFTDWQNKRIERERGLAFEAIPDWRDPSKFQADRGMMIEHLKPWGFSAADVYAIGDHRIAKYVRDNARKAQRAAEAVERARNAGKPKPGQDPAAKAKPSALRQRLATIVQTGRAAKTEAEKTSAVGALLRSTGAIK